MGSCKGRAEEGLKGGRNRVQKESCPWGTGALKSLGQRKGVPREAGMLEGEGVKSVSVWHRSRQQAAGH